WLVSLAAAPTLGTLEARVLHRRPHALGHDLDHSRAADVLGLELGTHGGADHQPPLIRRALALVSREHGRVRRDDALAPARPHHPNRRAPGPAAPAVLQ